MTRVALYARVSTNAQHTENQLRRLHEVAALRGWSVVGEYVETVSGAAKARPIFDKLMADARRRKFDTIAKVDVSRLGRSLSGLAGLFEEVRQIGVTFTLTVRRWTPAPRRAGPCLGWRRCSPPLSVTSSSNARWLALQQPARRGRALGVPRHRMGLWAPSGRSASRRLASTPSPVSLGAANQLSSK